jgi:hypothetical protein
MLTAAPVVFSVWIERRDRRLAARDVGARWSDVTGGIEAA